MHGRGVLVSARPRPEHGRDVGRIQQPAAAGVDEPDGWRNVVRNPLPPGVTFANASFTHCRRGHGIQNVNFNVYASPDHDGPPFCRTRRRTSSTASRSRPPAAQAPLHLQRERAAERVEPQRGSASGTVTSGGGSSVGKSSAQRHRHGQHLQVVHKSDVDRRHRCVAGIAVDRAFGLVHLRLHDRRSV